MIDRATGVLCLEHGTIDRTTTLKDLKGSPLIDVVFFTRKAGDFLYYTINPQLFGGQQFTSTVVFNNNELNWISIRFTGMESIPFDEENEMKRKAVHDNILRNLYGEPDRTYPAGMEYRFSWGSIQSNFDPRSAQAAMYVTYNKTEFGGAV